MIESRKHSAVATLMESPEQSIESVETIDDRMFDLVRDRLLKAIGAGGMWSISFRSDTDTDALFGETLAEFIARDVSAQFAPAALDTVAEIETGATAEPLEATADAVPAEPAAETSELATVHHHLAARMVA